MKDEIISFCIHCNSMTKTIGNRCGKCKEPKQTDEYRVFERLLNDFKNQWVGYSEAIDVIQRKIDEAYKKGMKDEASKVIISGDNGEAVERIKREARNQTIDECIEVAKNSKATFFGGTDMTEEAHRLTNDAVYEMKAEIVDNLSELKRP